MEGVSVFVVGVRAYRRRTSTAICKTVPRDIDIGMRSSKISFWLTAWNKRTRRVYVSKLNGIALNRQVARCHNGSIRTINNE